MYVVEDIRRPAPKVHALDFHVPIESALHHKGNSITEYELFAGCLPVPVSAPLKELLASVASVGNQRQNRLNDIQRSTEHLLRTIMAPASR